MSRYKNPSTETSDFPAWAIATNYGNDYKIHAATEETTGTSPELPTTTTAIEGTTSDASTTAELPTTTTAEEVLTTSDASTSPELPTTTTATEGQLIIRVEGLHN